MTRVIAGVARGRRLQVPEHGTRPTSDRVREAMFATLDHLLGGFVGIRVLDLYAGSGALGLESASRGAARVVLVEKDKRAAELIRANARVVGQPGVIVRATSVASALGTAALPFDLVLADPPYATASEEVTEVLDSIAKGGWLAPAAVVVVERSTSTGELHWPSGLTALRCNTYGETTVWYGLAASAEGDK